MVTLQESTTPKLLTINEASAALRISRWKLYDLIRNQKIETIKIGRRTLVTPDALDNMITQLRGEND